MDFQSKPAANFLANHDMPEPEGLVVTCCTEQEFHQAFGARVDIRDQMVYPINLMHELQAHPAYLRPLDILDQWTAHHLAEQVVGPQLHDMKEWDDSEWGQKPAAEKLKLLSPKALQAVMRLTAYAQEEDEATRHQYREVMDCYALTSEDFVPEV